MGLCNSKKEELDKQKGSKQIIDISLLNTEQKQVYEFNNNNDSTVSSIYDDIPMGYSQKKITEIYEINGKVIGKGAFGEVVIGHMKNFSDKQFAIKTIQNIP